MAQELWGNVKKNARRYINKPKEAGIQVIEDNSLDSFLLKTDGLLLQSNTLKTDYRLNANLVSFIQVKIIKHLANHAQLNEA